MAALGEGGKKRRQLGVQLLLLLLPIVGRRLVKLW